MKYDDLFVLCSGNNAELSPVKGKNKARKETLAALAAARKKNGSASTRKRKERSAGRTRGKEWRKTVNESTAESDVGNQRFVSDLLVCGGNSLVK